MPRFMIAVKLSTNQHGVHRPSLPAAICNPLADSKPIARPASSHNLLKSPERLRRLLPYPHMNSSLGNNYRGMSVEYG
jgi:hypothetical protein